MRIWQTGLLRNVPLGRVDALGAFALQSTYTPRVGPYPRQAIRNLLRRVLGIDLLDDVLQRLGRHLGSQPPHLLEHEVRIDKPVDGLELQVDTVRTVPEVRLGDAISELPDGRLLLANLRRR